MRSILIPGLINLQKSTINWMTLACHRMGLRGGQCATARLRNGIVVKLRPNLVDWYVFNEAFMTNVYKPAFDYLSSFRDNVTFLDLGANLGYTSLNAANVSERVIVRSFEPGPEHIDIFNEHMLKNPHLASRIQLNKYAVAGENCVMKWTFDPTQPGGSSLYKDDQRLGIQVQVRSLSEVLNECDTESIVIKMDIEGSEHDIFRKTPPRTWDKVRGIVIEPHHDPEGKNTTDEIIRQLSDLGFQMTKIHCDLWWGIK